MMIDQRGPQMMVNRLWWLGLLASILLWTLFFCWVQWFFA
jgi:hypothetical protein